MICWQRLAIHLERQTDYVAPLRYLRHRSRAARVGLGIRGLAINAGPKEHGLRVGLQADQSEDVVRGHVLLFREPNAALAPAVATDLGRRRQHVLLLPK